MKLLFYAIALSLAIEGCIFALFPDFMRKCLAEMARQPASLLRMSGIFALLLSITLAFFLRLLPS